MLSSEGRRWILAATILLAGLLQAWDSGLLAAELIPGILAGAGILAAVAAALIPDLRAAILGAVLPSAALVLAARWLFDAPLSGVLIVPVAAGALLLINGYIERREAQEVEGRQAAPR